MEQKEYGGYLEFEYFHGREFHCNAIAINSGRHGLEYLIRANSIKKIHLPYFLCDTVLNICHKWNVHVEFYNVTFDFQPNINEKHIEENDWIYIVNYYGQIDNTMVQKYKNQYRNIIIDNVQAFFQKPVFQCDTIYTCRKFFGVADGGYVYSNNKLSFELEKDYSYNRMKFLLGRFEKDANEFYQEYVNNNVNFENQDVKRMSELTQNIMRGLDYEYIYHKRNSNFLIMHEAFQYINKCNLIIPDGAFMYPLWVDCGNEIRKVLIKNKIYIPILWPDVLKHCKKDDLEYNMATNILPLPIDQRYDKNDIEYIINRVKECMKTIK